MKEETILKNEWINRYDLTAVTQSKYYKIVGCFAIGFELMKIHGKIKPYFVIYPLWLEDVKECFGFSFLYHCIEDTKGLNYSLSISKMLEKKEHISIITDEYGCLRGIVTMEDVIETMLGVEIVDENDLATDMQVLAREKWQKIKQKNNRL